MNLIENKKLKVVTASMVTAFVGLACSWNQVADVICVGFLMVPAYFILLGLSNLSNKNNKK